MFQPTYPIRTARLTLRPVTLGDLDDVYAYQCRPDVVPWMLGAEPRTREQSRASVVAMAGEDELRTEGDCLTLAVATDAGVIGTVELVWRSQVDRTAELGCVFHPDHGGRGLATEAATALLNWGFNGLRLHRIFSRDRFLIEPGYRDGGAHRGGLDRQERVGFACGVKVAHLVAALVTDRLLSHLDEMRWEGGGGAVHTAPVATTGRSAAAGTRQARVECGCGWIILILPASTVMVRSVVPRVV